MSLKSLFGSRTRVKLLKTFLLASEQEFYVRELSRILDEQINGVRRELENLRKLGILKAKAKQRKKFYTANKDYLFYAELRAIFLKSVLQKKDIASALKELGQVDLIIASGIFTKNRRSQVDLMVVGSVDQDVLSHFMDHYTPDGSQLRYSLMSKDNFLYRLQYNDSFIESLLEDEGNQILLNNLKKHVK